MLGYLEFSEDLLNEVIEEKGGKWLVYTSDKSRVLGTHDTKKLALKQLAAIEISKKFR